MRPRRVAQQLGATDKCERVTHPRSFRSEGYFTLRGAALEVWASSLVAQYLSIDNS